MSGIKLLLADRHGVYIPQIFVEQFEFNHPVKEDLDIVKDGPEHEWYWEAWELVLANATISIGGKLWKLHQDGDLWAYCEELMTEEERENFFEA